MGGDVNAASLQISKFAFGLVCGTDTNKRVCFKTNDIPVTLEGACVFNGEQRRCTWYGFEFDYVLPAGKTRAKLDCVARSDSGFTAGNPKAELKKHVHEFPYAIELHGSGGHFFNPQYITRTADTSDPIGTISAESESCSYAGRTVFDTEFRLRYPER